MSTRSTKKRAATIALAALDIEDQIKQKRQGTKKWQLPIPFQAYELPPFPTNLFRSEIKEFIEWTAQETQTPPEVAGTSIISVLSASTQGKVEVNPRGDWYVTLSTYTASVMPSGTGKTPAQEKTAVPLLEYERELMEELADEIAQAQSERRMIERELEHVEKKAATSSKPADQRKYRERAKELTKELLRTPERFMPQLIVDDVTSEGLAQFLVRQSERAFAFSSEGDLFSILRGRYNNGQTNFKIWLSGYDGSQHRVTRKGGRDILLNRPNITMGLTFQPYFLREFADTPQFDEQGLLPRVWFSMPHALVGYRKGNVPSMPSQVMKNYSRIIKTLLRLEKDKDVLGNLNPYYLYLSPEALDAYNAYFELNEAEMREGGYQESMLAWASKFGGSMMKMAGLLHLSDHYDNPAPWEIQISDNVIHRAAELREYFKKHTKAAYGFMKDDPRIEQAKYLLNRILSLKKPTFSKRDMFEKAKGKLDTVDKMEPALNLLIAHNYIRTLDMKRKQPLGRNPSPIYELNPNITPQKGNSANSAKENPLLEDVNLKEGGGGNAH